MRRKEFIASAGMGAFALLNSAANELGSTPNLIGIPPDTLETTDVFDHRERRRPVLSCKSNNPEHLRPGLLSTRVHWPGLGYATIMVPPSKFTTAPPIELSMTNNSGPHDTLYLYHMAVDHGWLIVNTRMDAKKVPDFLRVLRKQVEYDATRIHLLTAHNRAADALDLVTRRKLMPAAVIVGRLTENLPLDATRRLLPTNSGEWSN